MPIKNLASQMKSKISFSPRKIAEWMVYAYLICFPFSKALMEVFFTVGCVAWIIDAVQRRTWPRVDKVFALLLLMLGLTLTSTFFSEYPAECRKGIGKVFQDLLFFWMIYDLFSTEEKIRSLFKVAVGVFFYTFADGVYQYFVGVDLLRGRELSFVGNHKRVIGPFNNHGLFSAFLLSWTSVWVSCWITSLSSKSGRWLFGIASLVGGIALFYVQSRGVWLAFAFVLFFMLISIRKLRWVVIPLALIIAASVFLLPRSMIIHENAEGKEQSLVERVVLWDRAIQVIRAEPLWGTGVNTYSKAHGKYDKKNNWRVKGYYAHNSFLQFAAERGLICLSVFLWFVLAFVGRCVRMVRQDVTLSPEMRAFLRGILGAVLGMILFGMVDNLLEPLQSRMNFWMFLSLGYSILALAQVSPKKENL